MSWHNATLSDVCDFENGDRGKNYPGKSAILNEGYVDADEAGGVFPGLDSESPRYSQEPGSWGYATTPGSGEIETDPTLEHRRCVFQVLKRHFARYTPDKVAEVCGCRPEDVVSTAEACNRICALAGIDHQVEDVAPSDDPELLAVFGPTLMAIAFKLASVRTPRRDLTLYI